LSRMRSQARSALPRALLSTASMTRSLRRKMARFSDSSASRSLAARAKQT
jgi:hypothetical protein